MTHFELIFVNDVRCVPKFIFFQCGYPVLAPFVEKTFFTPLFCICSFVKDQVTLFMWVYFCTLPLIYWSIYQYHTLPVSHFIDYFLRITSSSFLKYYPWLFHEWQIDFWDNAFRSDWYDQNCDFHESFFGINPLLPEELEYWSYALYYYIVSTESLLSRVWLFATTLTVTCQ